MKKVVVFGATGGLGTAIARSVAEGAELRLVTIPWAVISTWTPKDIDDWFDTKIGDHEADIVFANGLTDPSRPPHELMESNVEFPLRVIEATRRRDGIRYLTFGSVMEKFCTIEDANPYIATKIVLGNNILNSKPGPPTVHLRLHTLYGASAPHPHMFLGQITKCLRTNTPFEMSAGSQYRQYHHVDDIARVIVNHLDRPWDVSAASDINGPETVRLVDLASAIFSHFDRFGLLRVGVLPTLATEVVEAPDYPATGPELFPHSRPSITGVISWLEDLIDRAS